MNDYQGGPSSLLDTTDCLEAIGVFRGWKNFLFVITIICLLLLQGAFWLVNGGIVKAGSPGPSEVAPEPAPVVPDVNAAAATDPNDPNAAVGAVETLQGIDSLEEAQDYFGGR